MSIHPRVWGVIGLILVAGSSPAVAQATNDVRCLLVSNIYSKAAKDPTMRQVAEAAKYFYLGRVHGRFTDAQLRSAMIAQRKSVSAESAGPAMAACARQMQASATVVQRIGQELAQQKK